MNARTCRRCGVPLTRENARVWQGRWVGQCRTCESQPREDGRRNLTLHPPVELHEALHEAAHTTGLTVNRLAVALLTEGLARLKPEVELTRK